MKENKEEKGVFIKLTNEEIAMVSGGMTVEKEIVIDQSAKIKLANNDDNRIKLVLCGKNDPGGNGPIFTPGN